MKRFSGFIFWLFGWKIRGKIPDDIKKSVMIVAPHTSNWDFIIGRLACWKLGIPSTFLIKKEFFFFPMGYLLKALGAAPVDRSKGASAVSQTIDIINRNDFITITITPEGTRKYTENWKKGFYIIAEKAAVPIVLGFINYRDKTGGVGGIIYPTGNFDEDFAKILDFYKRNSYPKNPELFNLTNQLNT
jgi:1-acyl-sn-glycerol-3-phosphate acyltransferase